MSGIVAILVAGMTMRGYAHKNLSSGKTQDYAGMQLFCLFMLWNSSSVCDVDTEMLVYLTHDQVNRR